ncbi:hypothetical protein TNIN_109391 [Trichonephila inaurata madagascariensis]|uniref:Uncharacterized protein n=1 Tax=Trichonephila inaurata madagascariensis TaxID=2747483 RepID=A0A8X7BZ82_9ARAC|nr:hypothetical protein TNIN_109391 [Trichonephila inaurata madagascariensis]
MDYLSRSSLLLCCCLFLLSNELSTAEKLYSKRNNNAKFRRGDLFPKNSFKSGDDTTLEKGSEPGNFQEIRNVTLQAQDDVRSSSDFVRSRNSRAERPKLFKPRFGSHPSTVQSRPFEASVKNESNNAVSERRRPGKKISTFKPKSYIMEKEIKTIPSQITTLTPKVETTRPEERVSSFRGTAVRSKGLESGKRRHDSKAITNIPQVKNLKTENNKLLEQPLSGLNMLTKVEPFKGKTSYKPNFSKKSITITPSKYNASDLAHATREKSIFTGSAFTSTISPESKRKIFRNTRRQFKNQNVQAVTLSYDLMDTESPELETNSPLKETVELLLPTSVPIVPTESLETDMQGKESTSKSSLLTTKVNSSENSRKFKLTRRKFNNPKITSQNDSLKSRQQSAERNLIGQDVTITLPTHETEDIVALGKETSGEKSAKMGTDNKISESIPNPDSPEPKPTTLVEELSPLSPRRSIKSRKRANSLASERKKNNFPAVVRNVASKFNAKSIADEKEELVFAETAQSPFISTGNRKTGYRRGKRPIKRPVIRKGTQTISEDNSSDLSGIANENISPLTQRYDQSLSPPTTQIPVQEQSHDVKHINKPNGVQKDSNKFSSTKRANIARIRLNKLNHVYRHISSSESKSSKKQHSSVPKEDSQLAYSLKDHADLSHEGISITNVGNKLSPKKEYEVIVNLKSTENPINAQLSNSELTPESPESTVKSKQRLTLKKSLLSRRKFPSKLSKNKNLIDKRVTENLQNPNTEDVLNTNDELITSSTNVAEQVVPFRTTSDKLQTKLSILEDGYNKNTAVKDSGSSFNRNRNRFNRRKFNQVNYSVTNESSINSQLPKRRYKETVSVIPPVDSSEDLAAVNQRTEPSVKNETKHLDLHIMVQNLFKDQLTETEGVDSENTSIFSGSTEQPARSKLNRRKFNRRNFKNQKNSSRNSGLSNKRNSVVQKKAETLEIDYMKSLGADFIATNEQYVTEQHTQAQNLQNTNPHNVEDDNLSISADSVRTSKNRRTKFNRKRNNKFSSSSNVSSFNTRAASDDRKHSSIPKTHNREGFAESKEERIPSPVEEFEQSEPSRPVKNTNNPQVQEIEDFKKQETEFERVSFKRKKNKFVRKKFDDKKLFSLDESSINFQPSEKQNSNDQSTEIASKIHNNEEYDNSNEEDIPSYHDELKSARGSYEQNDTPLESKVLSNRKRNRNVTHKRKFKKSSSTSRNNSPSNTQSSKQRNQIQTSVETATLLKQLDKTHYFINTNDNTASSLGDEQEQFVDHKPNPVPVDVQLYNRESADEQNAASSNSSEPSTKKRKRINRKRLHKLNRTTENKSSIGTEINGKHNSFTKDITVPLPTPDTKDTANEDVKPLFSLRNESNKLVPIKTAEFLADEQLHDMENINNINTTFAESNDGFNVEKKYNQKELHTQKFISEDEMHLSTTLGEFDSNNKYTSPFPKHKSIRLTRRPSSTKSNIRQGTTSTKSNHPPFNILEAPQTGSERWIPLKISQSSNFDMQVSNISDKKKSISSVIPKQYHSSRSESSILNYRKSNPVFRTTAEASLTKDEDNASSEETKLYPVEKLPETIASFRGPQYPVNVELSQSDKVSDKYNEDEKTEMKPKQSNSPHSSPYGQSNSSRIENIEILSHHTPEETLNPSFVYYNSRYTNKTGQKTIEKNKFSKYYDEDYPLMKEIPTKAFDETENYRFPEYDDEFPSFGDEKRFSKVTQKHHNVMSALEEPNLDASGIHLSEKQKESQFIDNTSFSGNNLQWRKVTRPAGSYKERHSSFDSKLFSSPMQIISESPYLTFYHSSKSKPKAQNFPYHFTSSEYVQNMPKMSISNTKDWSQVDSRIKMPSSISELNLKAADTSPGSRSNSKGMSPTMENTESQKAPIETINQEYMHYPSSKNPTLLVPSDEAKYYFYSSAMKPDSLKQIYSRPDFASNLPYSSKIDGAYDYSSFSKPIISSPLSKVYDSKQENGQYYLYSMNLGQKPTSKERNRTTLYPTIDDQYKTPREKTDLQAHSTKNIPQELYNSFEKTALSSISLPDISKKKQTEVLFNTSSEDLSNVLQINTLYNSTGVTEDLQEKSKGKVENLNNFNSSNTQLLNFKVEDSTDEHISNIVPSKNELISSNDKFNVNSLSPFPVDDFSNYSSISEFSTETPHPDLRTIASVPVYLNDSTLEVYPISTENSLAQFLLPNSQDFESSETRIALITATEVPMNFMLTNVNFTQQNQVNIQKTNDVVDVRELHPIERLFSESNVSDSLTFHRGSTALKPDSDDLSQIVLDSHDASAKSTSLIPVNEKELHLIVSEFLPEYNNTKDEETGMHFAMTRNGQLKDASTDTQGYNIENGEKFKNEKKVTTTHPMLELVVQNSDAHDFISKISDKSVTVRLFNPKTQTYHSILIKPDDNISKVETKIGKENSASTNALPNHTYNKSEFEKENTNNQSIALFPEESVATEPTETGLSSKNDNYLNIFPLTASLESDASNNNSSDKYKVTKISSSFDRNLISIKDLKELFIKNRLENQNFKKEDNDFKTYKTFEKSENKLTYSNKFSENNNYLDVFSQTKPFGLDLPNNISSPAHQFVERPLLPEEKLIKLEDLRELLINVMEENKNLQDEINKQKKFVSPLESVDKFLQPNKSLKNNKYLDIFSSTESFEFGMPNVISSSTVTEKPDPKRKLVNVDDLKQVIINSMKEDPYSKVENKNQTKFMSPLELENEFLHSNTPLKNSNYLDVFSSTESFEFGMPKLIPSTTKTIIKKPEPGRKLVNINDLKHLLINSMKGDQDSKDENKSQTKFMSPLKSEDKLLHLNKPLKNSNYFDGFSSTESFEFGMPNLIPSITKTVTEKPDPERKLVNIDDLKQFLINSMKEDRDSKGENKDQTKFMSPLETEEEFLHSNKPLKNNDYLDTFSPTESFELGTANVISKKFTENPPPEKKLINIDDLRQLLINSMKEDRDLKDENKNETKFMSSSESEAKLINSNYPYTNQAYFNMLPQTNSFKIDTSEIVSIGKSQITKNDSKPGVKSQNAEFLNERPVKNSDKIQNASSQNNDKFHMFYQNLEDKIMDLDKSTESFESDLFDAASSNVHEITALPSKSENDLMNIDDLKDFLIKSMEESSTYEDSKEKEIDLLNLQEDDEIIDELSLLIDFLAPTTMSNYSDSDIQFSVSESVVMNPHFEIKTEEENSLGKVIDSTQNTFTKHSSYFEKQTQLNVPKSQHGEKPLEKVLSIMETYQVLKPNVSKEFSHVSLKLESPAHFEPTATDLPQHLVPLYFDIQNLETPEENRRDTKFPKYSSKFKKNALPSVEYDFEAFPKTILSGTSFAPMFFENIPNNQDVPVINVKNETNVKHRHNTDEIQWNDSNIFSQYALPSSLANSQKEKKFHEPLIGNGVIRAHPGTAETLNYEKFPPILSTNSYPDALHRKAFENYNQILDFSSKSKKMLSQNVKNRNPSQYTLSDLSPNFLQETPKNHLQKLDFSNEKEFQSMNAQNSSNSHVLQNLEISTASGLKEGSYIHPEKLTLKDLPQHIQEIIFDKGDGSNIYTANSGIENSIPEDNKNISFEEIKYSSPRPNIKNERNLSSLSPDIPFKNIIQDAPGKIPFSDLIQGFVENGLHTIGFIGGKNYDNLYAQVSNPETHPGIHFDESTDQEVMADNNNDSESAIKPIKSIPVDEMKKRKKISEIPKLTPGLDQFMTLDYLDIGSLKSSIEQNRKGITDAENRFHSMKDDLLALNDYDDYLYPRFKTTMVK